MDTLKRIVAAFVFLFAASFLFAQQKQLVIKPVAPALPPQNNAAKDTTIKDSTRNINLIRSNILRLEKKDSTDLQVLVGNAILRQGKTFFYGDSIIMNKQKNTIEVFGNIHINDADSVNVYSQYLIYYGDTRIANLKKTVKLTDGKAILTTEELEYDLNSKTGTYLNGGKIVNGKSTLTSKEGYYYADTRDAYFKKDVRMIDPDYTMATDTLLYNADSQLATFVARTTINDGKSIIKTSQGFYDMKNGNANFGKRPVIQDSTQYITADSISFNKVTGDGHARGNFLYRDTVQGLIVMSGTGIFNRDKKTFLATEKPVMIVKQDKDSLFITADTLDSGIRLDTVYVRDTAREALEAINEKLQTEKDSLTNAMRLAQTAAETVVEKGKPDLIGGASPGKKRLPKTATKAKSPPVENPPPLKDSLSVAVPSDLKIVEDSLHRAKDLLVKDSVMDSLHMAFVHVMDSINKKALVIKDSMAALPKPAIDRVDSVRYFFGYHHVKMFADSMQAVCDSLLFSGKDSIFRLFNDPVVWSKESQISGDTIYLHTKNKKPEHVEVWENAFSISKSNDQFYNQLKGNTINGFFKDGDIDHIRAKGSAESLYYLQDDDSAYTGANYAKADLINLYFAKKALDKITWIHEVEGGFYPVRQVPEERQRFRNFKWQEARRPKTRLELFQ
jgi:hypothetical protein